MADGSVPTQGALDSAKVPNSMLRKLRDMGDGTFAEVVALGTGTAASAVQGAAADGAAVAGNPVRIAGKDGSGNTQDLITDTTGNLSVGTGTAGTAAANVVTVQGIASATPVVVGGAVAAGATDSGNPLKIGGKYTATNVTLTDGQRGDALMSPGGAMVASIAGPISSGADGLTNASIVYPTSSSAAANSTSTRTGLSVAPVLFNGTSWDRARGDTNGAYTVAKPVTSGGLSAARVVTGTEGVIKGSAGQLYKLHSVRNANAAVRYLHLYDKATAPALSTDTPVLTISLAASSVQNDVDIGGNIGVAFANGIAWAYTTDNVAIPTTAATSTELMFSGAYK